MVRTVCFSALVFYVEGFYHAEVTSRKCLSYAPNSVKFTRHRKPEEESRLPGACHSAYSGQIYLHSALFACRKRVIPRILHQISHDSNQVFCSNSCESTRLELPSITAKLSNHNAASRMSRFERNKAYAHSIPRIDGREETTT